MTPFRPGDDMALTRIVKQVRHGQITIPKEFREALSISPGDLLSLTLMDGKLEITPLRLAPKEPNWTKQLYDLFAPVRESLAGYSEDEINEAIDEAVAEVRKAKKPTR